MIHIFTVSKDERDLIEDFILYNGLLFGFQNLTIIDNGSTDTDVLKVYRRYIKLGISVVYERGYEGNSQGAIFTKYMLRKKHETSKNKKGNFVIGMDTDEFIVHADLMCKTGITPDIMFKSITHELNVIPKNSTKVKMTKYFSSVPDPSDDTFKNGAHDRPCVSITNFIQEVMKPPKTFFRAHAFMSTVNGCHTGRVSMGTEYRMEKLAYVHYHNTGCFRSVERARNIIAGYGYVNVDAPLIHQCRVLQNCKSGIGRHRIVEYLEFIVRTLVLNTIVSKRKLPTANQLVSISKKYVKVDPGSLDRLLKDDDLKMLKDFNGLNLDAKSLEALVLHDPMITQKTCVKSTTISRIISNGLKRPSVAIMLSGHVRNFTKRVHFWRNFVEENPDVDIYCFFWNEEGGRSNENWIDIGAKKPDFNSIRSVLKPVKMVIADHAPLFDSFSFQQKGLALYYANFSQLGKSVDFSRNIGSQLYSIMKCWELVKSSGNKYDILMRLRADAIIENFDKVLFNDFSFTKRNVLVVNGSKNHQHPMGGGGCLQCDREFSSGTRKHDNHCRDVCDIFFYGNETVMSRVCQMFKHVKELVYSFKEYNEKASKDPSVSKHFRYYKDVIGVANSRVFECSIKCFYPERLIREYMKDFWVISDFTGMVPTIRY